MTTTKTVQYEDWMLTAGMNHVVEGAGVWLTFMGATAAERNALIIELENVVRKHMRKLEEGKRVSA